MGERTFSPASRQSAGRTRAARLAEYDDKAWAMRDAFDGLIDVIRRRVGR